MLPHAQFIRTIEDREDDPVDVQEIVDWLINNGFADEVELLPLALPNAKFYAIYRRYAYRPKPYAEPQKVIQIGYDRMFNDNLCWFRFVITKELMHGLDDPDHHTETAIDIKRLISQFAQLPVLRLLQSPQAAADLRAIHIALAALAPACARERFRSAYQNGDVSDITIAHFFKIPQILIPTIMSDEFQAFYDINMRPDMLDE